MGTPKLTRYTMNTFHLASLALLAGLISAAPTSTYRHVDAVVPEIEFADVDDAVYNLVTFTIDPAKIIQSVDNKGDDFVQWITKLAEMSYMCEKGTTVYSVYEGHWQTEKDKPAVVDPNNKAKENTYTIFEKFVDQDGLDAHSKHTPGTAIVMWRTERNEFMPAVGPGRTEATDRDTGKIIPGEFVLALTVTHPTGEVFDELMKLGKVVVKPEEKKLNGRLCGGYPKVEPERVEPEHAEPEHAEPEHAEPEHAKPLLAKPRFARGFGKANKRIGT